MKSTICFRPLIRPLNYALLVERAHRLIRLPRSSGILPKFYRISLHDPTLTSTHLAFDLFLRQSSQFCKVLDFIPYYTLPHVIGSPLYCSIIVTFIVEDLCSYIDTA